MKYKRVLIKLSGEALAGKYDFGYDHDELLKICGEIKQLVNKDIQVGIVVGGGNFFRGRSNDFLTRTTADNIGMLATVMNATALKDVFAELDCNAYVASSIELNKISDYYNQDKVMNHLNDSIVIFAGGLNCPYFSTDTLAAVRSIEIGADILIKATNVDGIYDDNPHTNSDAKKLPYVSYMEVLNKELGVLDLTAITLCKENKMPIIVCNVNEKETLLKVCEGKEVGSLIF